MTEIVVIDLETLSTAPNAAVLSLGVYCESFEDTTELFLNVDEQIRAGAAVDWSTISWWLQQPEDARLAQARAFRPVPMEGVLTYLATLLNTPDDYVIMSNPASFDLAILRWHWMRLGLNAPWGHGKERCYRTYRAQIDPVMLREYELAAEAAHSGSKHSALVDAKRQHYVITAAMRDGLVVR